MKIKNLADFPQQLDDGRVIGAAGTKEDTREYDLEALAKEDKNRAPGLTKEDKKRVKDGTLIVIEEAETNPVEKDSSGAGQTGEKKEVTKAKPNGGKN